ncbi:MAG: hypothetical protein IJ594_07775 [Oscillospiraceae bacterium]|nr:hypothetical protein [Oscillospiraceae bacterium]
MALDKEYFDAIHIDVVKKKYYNANKVEAVFADIRQQAAELLEENARLRQELSAVNARKEDLGDAAVSAQAIYQRILQSANARAAAILRDARQESEQLRQTAEDQREFALRRVEECLSRVRELQKEAIESVNAEWQRFLIDLYPEEGGPSGDAVPADLRDKVGAIAQELRAINDPEDIP